MQQGNVDLLSLALETEQARVLQNPFGMGGCSLGDFPEEIIETGIASFRAEIRQNAPPTQFFQLFFAPERRCPPGPSIRRAIPERRIGNSPSGGPDPPWKDSARYRD